MFESRRRVASGSLDGFRLGAGGSLGGLGLGPGRAFGGFRVGLGGAFCGGGLAAGGLLGGLGGGAGGARAFGGVGGLVQPAAQHRQAIALLEADGGLGGRAGLDDVAVPAPHRAGARHQGLARAQFRLVGGAVADQSDLRQRARQGGRGAHQGGKRCGALRQAGHRVEGRQFVPVPGGGGVGGGFQLLAQRGAEGGFQPGRHL